MPELGEKRKRTFGVVHKYGTKKLTHTTSLIGRNASNSRAQITPSDTNENEWANVVESPFVMRKRKRTDERAKKWAELLPFLTEAYIQGYGVQVPVPQSLKATDDVFLTCACKEKKSTYVTTVYKCGIRPDKITYCKNCPEHSLPVVMMRRHLFPLTPSDPQHAIHIEQMRSFHNMHYICRVSIHAIAEWARAEYHFKLPIPASFKQRLTEALPIYGRLMLNLEKKHRDLCDLDDACPACRYASGPKIIAGDGNQSLRRFAKTKDPKEVAFEGQEEVDRPWVKPEQLIKYESSATDGCETWQALNSKKRGKASHLDQTGAFACTCGHGHPVAIIDMNTPGEQYTYMLSCLQKVIDLPLYGSNIRIMYDVGCKLRPALQRTDRLHSIKDVDIAVGIFHITGHNPECQIHFHPRLKTGFGLQDGEHLERLWSFLNGFVSMTRHMSSLNRRLTLTIALNFYAQQKNDNLGQYIRRRYVRTIKLKENALEALRKAGIDVNDEEAMKEMEEKWYRHVAESRRRNAEKDGSSRFAQTCRAIENLRVAIAIYDIINQAFKHQGNGHNQTQNLAGQRQAARNQIEKRLITYNTKINAGPIFGFEDYGNDINAVLRKDSHLRFRMNIICTVEDNAPYDAFHGLQRANEELAFLKDEAASVLKYGQAAIDKLEMAINAAVTVPYNLEACYGQIGLIQMWKRKLERAKSWQREQAKQLAVILDSTEANPGSLSLLRNAAGTEEEDLEEEEEETNVEVLDPTKIADEVEDEEWEVDPTLFGDGIPVEDAPTSSAQ